MVNLREGSLLMGDHKMLHTTCSVYWADSEQENADSQDREFALGREMAD